MGAEIGGQLTDAGRQPHRCESNNKMAKKRVY